MERAINYKHVACIQEMSTAYAHLSIWSTPLPVNWRTIPRISVGFIATHSAFMAQTRSCVTSDITQASVWSGTWTRGSPAPRCHLSYAHVHRRTKEAASVRHGDAGKCQQSDWIQLALVLCAQQRLCVYRETPYAVEIGAGGGRSPIFESRDTEFKVNQSCAGGCGEGESQAGSERQAAENGSRNCRLLSAWEEDKTLSRS